MKEKNKKKKMKRNELLKIGKNIKKKKKRKNNNKKNQILDDRELTEFGAGPQNCSGIAPLLDLIRPHYCRVRHLCSLEETDLLHPRNNQRPLQFHHIRNHHQQVSNCFEKHNLTKG